MQLHSPCRPTQAIYRRLLMAMSHPGKIYNVEFDGWDSLIEAVAETLFDHEVSFVVIGDKSNELADRIFALTKARRENVENADYVIVCGHSSTGALERAKTGIPEYPDRSATFIYLVDESTIPDGEAPLISGPGIAAKMRPTLNPLLSTEWQTLKEINSEYPLGIDTFFLSYEGKIMAIPRSTGLEK